MAKERDLRLGNMARHRTIISGEISLEFGMVKRPEVTMWVADRISSLSKLEMARALQPPSFPTASDNHRGGRYAICDLDVPAPRRGCLDLLSHPPCTRESRLA